MKHTFELLCSMETKETHFTLQTQSLDFIIYMYHTLTPSVMSFSLTKTMTGSGRSLNVLPATAAATTGDPMRVLLGGSAIGNRLDSSYSEKNKPMASSSKFLIWLKMVAGRIAAATCPGNSPTSTLSSVSTFKVAVHCTRENVPSVISI